MRLTMAGLLLGAVLLSAPARLSAQCAMCRSALTNSAEGRAMSDEFNRAILLMLFAPYAVFGSVGAVLMRRRIAAALSRARRRWRARPVPPVDDPPADGPRVH